MRLTSLTWFTTKSVGWVHIAGLRKLFRSLDKLGQSSEITQLQVDSSALSIELRRSPVPRTLFDLWLQSARSGFQSALATVLDGIIGLMKWVYKTCTAHTFILAILALSVLFNAFHSYRDTFSWWHERNAGKFMRRMGVTPNTVMTKAIQVHDFEELLGQNGDLPTLDTSPCYSVFYDENHLDDLDAPILASASDTAMSSRNSAHRLQRTRQRLGTYRHDLLVAMRVVNSIEKEVLQAEWEQWVMVENRRCRQVAGLLKSAENSSATLMPDSLAARADDVREWYDDYCVSCRNEYERQVAQ